MWTASAVKYIVIRTSCPFQVPGCCSPHGLNPSHGMEVVKRSREDSCFQTESNALRTMELLIFSSRPGLGQWRRTSS